MTPGRCLALALLVLLAGSGCQSTEARVEEHLRRGNALVEEKSYAEAVIEFRSAVALQPNHAQAHYALARAHIADGELEDALRQVDELLFTEGIDAELRLSTQMLRAQILDMQKKPVEALAAYEKALELDPDSFDANLLL